MCRLLAIYCAISCQFLSSGRVRCLSLSSTTRIMGDKKAEKEFIVEFIEVYRGLPALWDVKCKDYTNRAKKGEQYDVLIEKYREKYPDAEKQEVVKKINSLRTNFRKELKRIRDAEKSGAGAEDVEPTLWYFDEMKFLVTQETPTASISTMDISQDVHDNEDRCDANETSAVSGLFY